MYPGAFQVEFLVQHAEEVLDGEIAGCLQGHGSTGPCQFRLAIGIYERPEC